MAFFANPTAALAEYELTEAEFAALRLMDAKSLDAGGGLARRILRTLASATHDVGTQ